MSKYDTWLDRAQNLELPRYQDLPEIPLYLDQILEFTNDKLSVLFAFEENILTQAMINNYVKHKAMPSPEKKRYNKDHLVYIIAITILKQIMNINHITKGVDQMLEIYGIENGYNMFIGYVEESMRFTVSEVYDKPNKFQASESGSMVIPLKAATLAFAGKLLADYSFKNLVLKEKK